MLQPLLSIVSVNQHRQVGISEFHQARRGTNLCRVRVGRFGTRLKIRMDIPSTTLAAALQSSNHTNCEASLLAALNIREAPKTVLAFDDAKISWGHSNEGAMIGARGGARIAAKGWMPGF